MAAITPTAFKIVRVGDLGQEEVVTSAAITGGISSGRQAAAVYVDPSTAKAVAAQSDTLAHTTGGTNSFAIIGLISTAARTSLAEESCTILRDADVFLGADALDGLDYGAPVYISAAAAGGLVDAAPAGAGTTIIQIGHVVPSFREGSVDKLLRINTLPYSKVGSIVAAGA